MASAPPHGSLSLTCRLEGSSWIDELMWELCLARKRFPEVTSHSARWRPDSRICHPRQDWPVCEDRENAVLQPLPYRALCVPKPYLCAVTSTFSAPLRIAGRYGPKTSPPPSRSGSADRAVGCTLPGAGRCSSYSPRRCRAGTVNWWPTCGAGYLLLSEILATRHSRSVSFQRPNGWCDEKSCPGKQGHQK